MQCNPNPAQRSFLSYKTKIPDRYESFSSTSVGNSIFNTTDRCSAHLLFSAVLAVSAGNRGQPF